MENDKQEEVDHYHQPLSEFIENTLHVKLDLVSRLGGHSSARTYRNSEGKNVGWQLVNSLWKKIKELNPMLANIMHKQ